MVFNSDYDMSLWLLVNVDYENKLKIMDLINNIPNNLYIEIKEKLMIINKNRNNNICFDEVFYFHGNCVVDDKLYFYSINPYNYGLSLGYSIINCDGDYDRVYEINLFPFVNSELYDEDNNLLIGRVEYDLRCVYPDETKDLYLSNNNGSVWKILFQVSFLNKKINVRIVNSKKFVNDVMLINNKLVRKKIK